MEAVMAQEYPTLAASLKEKVRAPLEMEASCA